MEFFLFFLLFSSIFLGCSSDEVTQFSFLNFTTSNTNGLISFLNTAQVLSQPPVILLCDSRSGQQGQSWYNTAVQVRGFHTQFSFSVSGNGSDGFSFVIQSSGVRVSGPGGDGCLGYGGTNPNVALGIPSSLAIEFDMFMDNNLGDLDGNHISIHRNHESPNSAFESYSIGYTASIPNMKIGSIHTVDIVYTPLIGNNGGFSIQMDTNTAPNLLVSKSLESNVPLLNYGKAWIGFTASTGLTGQTMQLLSWKYNFLGVTNATNSYLTASNAVAGIISTIVVQGVDQFDNIMLEGGAKFIASLSSQSDLKFNFTDFENGTYTFSYLPTLASSAEIHVTLDGIEIKDSPFSVSVVPGAVYPQNCIAFEEPNESGLTGGIAGTQQQFEIQLQDFYGNNITDISGKEFDIAAFVAGPTNQSAMITYTTNGQYTASYTLDKSGEYHLSVEINGTPIRIASGNKSVFIEPAAVNPVDCFAIGAEENAWAGFPSQFTVQLVDSFGNFITNVVEQPNIKVTIDYKHETGTTNITYLGKGVYEVLYKVSVAAIYTLTVEINGVNIQGSPFSPQVLPYNSTYPPNCEAFGINLNYTMAGNRSVFYVISRDPYGNNRTEPDTSNLQWSITFKKENKVVNSSGVIVNWDKSMKVYEVAYNFTLAGKVDIFVQINNMSIAGSPFPATVTPGLSFGPHCKAFGSALTGAYTDELETFWITSYDLWFNLQDVGGDKFEVALKDNIDGSLKSTNLSDLHNGSYAISYKLDKSGVYSMSIKLNGLDISGSPFSIQCKWAGLPTPIIIIIGVSASVVIVIVGVAVWVYHTKFKKRKLYQPLRDTEIQSE